MLAIHGIPIQMITGPGLRAWEWDTAHGTRHQITWTPDSNRLLYSARNPDTGQWSTRTLPADLATIAPNTVTTAHRHVLRILAPALDPDEAA